MKYEASRGVSATAGLLIHLE